MIGPPPFDPSPIRPFGSGSNGAAHQGFVYAAIAAYLEDETALDYVWDWFRTFACDPGAPYADSINVNKGVEFGWAHDDDNPCAVNPLGTTDWTHPEP